MDLNRADERSLAVSDGSKTIQQNCVRSSTTNKIIWPFLFITSAENLVQNSSAWVVDSVKSVSGSGFKERQV